MTLARKNRLVCEKLLEWYGEHARSFPWRNTRNPYRIWVSEVILQQTQVSRGEDYYRRFLKRFPSLKSLAEANWNRVLPVWRGLGYYQRGRNMLKTAKIIRSEFRGRFPKDRNELLSLPGIGPYTASAIRCFAFGIPEPAIDTNLRRVFQRLYGCLEVDVEKRADSFFAQFENSAHDLNQAFMDLGSSLCKSRSTDCGSCPLSAQCHFRKTGEARHLNSQPSTQVKRKKTKKPVIDVGVACIHRNGKYLIAKRKPERGGLWEFPGGKRESGEDIRACLKREVKEEIGIEISVRPSFLITEKADGQYLWRLHFCRCQVLRGRERATEHEKLMWVSTEELQDYPFPATNRGAIERLN